MINNINVTIDIILLIVPFRQNQIKKIMSLHWLNSYFLITFLKTVKKYQNSKQKSKLP